MMARHPDIRELLRQNDDGLTIEDIATQLAMHADACRRVLPEMPDAYVDRWVGPFRGQYQAVWCVVVPPENCPRPTKAG